MSIPAAHSLRVRASGSRTVRREIASAYLASAARVLAWAGVSAILFRSNETHFAAFALVRATLGLLNYLSLGLAPALIRQLARTMAQTAQPLAVQPLDEAPVLEYAAPRPDPVAAVYSNALLIAYLVSAVSFIAVLIYAQLARTLHDLPVKHEVLVTAVMLIGIGTLGRLFSDAPGAVLQARGFISLDNWLAVIAETSWVLITAAYWSSGELALDAASKGYAASAILLMSCRLLAARRITRIMTPRVKEISAATIRALLGTGALIAAAQLADFLYAPTNFILIKELLGSAELAAYAPAVQLDAALLLLASGVASVLLPRSALAHAAGDITSVRRYYLKGTVITTLALLAGTIAAWLLAPIILPLWLGQSEILPVTLSILPLVLIHTVLGGTSAVGRSVLLGIGRARPFTIAALTAGVANVILAYCFIRYFQLGLKGIVYATILVVFARCVLWMPPYILWSLRHPAPTVAPDVPPAEIPPPPPTPIA